MGAAATAIADAEQLIAKEAIVLQRSIIELGGKLDEIKEEIRSLANGQKMEIVVDGEGKVNVSSPREESSKIVLEFDHEKINKFPDLKQKLLDVGVAKEKTVVTSAAKASVTIKPNV